MAIIAKDLKPESVSLSKELLKGIYIRRKTNGMIQQQLAFQ